MTVAYPVAKGRCACCGHRKPMWTPAAIVSAVTVWTETHGRAPNTADWRKAAVDHPASQTVVEMFGSFSVAYGLAGVDPPARVNTTRHWTRDAVIESVFQFVYLHRRLPTARDWNHDPRWPSVATVRRLFGTWNGGIVAAGYEPTHARRSTVGYRNVTGRVTARAAA